MNHKISFALLTLAISAIAVISFTSCRSHRLTGFDLMATAEDSTDTTAARTLIAGTKPIDSTNADSLIFDMFRIEIDEYPKLIKAYTRVYDSAGFFITNMADPYRKDTSIVYFKSITETLGKLYNVRDVPIVSFTVREYGAKDSIAYEIVLSVDYSGSMDAIMDAIFEGTELFVGMKDTYDKIGITSFNNQLSVKVPMQKEKQQILNLYKTNREDGLGQFSGVYDALWGCMQLYDTTTTNVPKVLVIFTDGDDNYSKSNVGQIIERAKASKVTIFTVAFGYAKDDNLKHIADYTGGRFYRATSKKQLVAIFRDIYMSLKYYYYVTYKPPEFWGYHKIAVSMKHPERSDTLYAYGEYDTSDLFPWDSIGKYFTRPIFFDFDSAVVKPESFLILDEVADKMLAYPKLRLEIQGHTDNVGPRSDPEGYNQKLSDNRSKAVFDELVKRGIDPRRLRSRGFGMSRPITANDTDEGRAKNRRTEFHVLAK